jgi:signal transduction histidine kinase
MQRNVLLISRSEKTSTIIREAVEERGHRLTVAMRALDGLDIAREHTPDLIIAELSLSDMHGRELATTLRAEDAFVRVPIVTILAPDQTHERDLCIAAGFTGFLDAPLKSEVLPLQIDFFLSGGVHVADDEERVEQVRSKYVQDFLKGLEARIRELERRNDELQRIDDMKDTFIQLTAHELRTPLTLVTGYSRLLEDYPPLRRLMETDLGIAPLLQGLSESINRMQSVIEDLLTVSRIMTRKIELNMSQINLGAVIKQVLANYQEALRERHLQVYFNAAEFPDNMRGDEGLLYMMILNLMSNAIKYTPDGGSITFRCEIKPNVVQFSIRDTGIGIDPQYHERIFDRMTISHDINTHTTSKTTFRGGGLGLGLAICRGIVEAHGGRIWVESPGYDVNRLPGSEFFVRLPLVAAPSTKPMQPIRRLTSRPQP